MKGTPRIIIVSVVGMALFAAFLWITWRALDGSEAGRSDGGPAPASQDGGGDPAPPSTPPDRTGDIVGTVTAVLEGPGEDDDVLGSFDVEGDPDSGREYDAATVTVTTGTSFFRDTADGVAQTTFDPGELEAARVEVWFTGPVAESYPVQATAGTILILD